MNTMTNDCSAMHKQVSAAAKALDAHTAAVKAELSIFFTALELLTSDGKLRHVLETHGTNISNHTRMDAMAAPSSFRGGAPEQTSKVYLRFASPQGPGGLVLQFEKGNCGASLASAEDAHLLADSAPARVKAMLEGLIEALQKVVGCLPGARSAGPSSA